MFQKLQNIRFGQVLSALLMLLVLFSCNTYKYVPEDKYILSRNRITDDSKEIKNEELNNLVRQKPNKRFFRVFRLHLGLYNLSKPGSEKWMSRKFREMGEPPVIFDPLLKDKTKVQISLFLANKGYYNAIVEDTLILKKKELIAEYSIKIGQPYRIQNITYSTGDSSIYKIILADTSSSKLKKGKRFDTDLLQEERDRIENLLRNNAYFNFTRDYIYYEADTTIGNHQVDLIVHIKDFQTKDNVGNVITSKHSKYKISNIRIHVENKRQIDTAFSEEELLFTQLLEKNDIQLVYHDGVTVKPNIIVNNVYISENSLFNQSDVDATYQALSALKVFRYINIVFNEHPSALDDTLKTVDCRIQLATVNFQAYQTDAEATYSSGPGVAGILTYQNKNFFNGAELLNLKFKGATEYIKKRSEIEFRNTLELGTEASIQFPKFLLPFKTENFSRKYNPKTSVSMSYTYMSRIQYTYELVNASFGYIWKGARYNSYQINPISVNMQMIDVEPDYYAYIKNTPLRNMFEDQLLIPTSFTFSYNNQRIQKNTSFLYFKINGESAGNTIRQFSIWTKADTAADGNYKLFGNQFAQYIKSDVEFRYYLPVNTSDKVVFRLFTGVANAYGNSTTVPYIRKYFSGGPSSIRAWQIRSLGPGSFALSDSTAYPDETGDIKIEANIEYRFKLFWIIEGALFLDAGNIWSNKNDIRPGTLFKFDNFINQMAIGTGFGTRFDFSFFIFRFDLGFKLYDPSQVSGQRWSFNRSVRWDFFNPSIAIGYPF